MSISFVISMFTLGLATSLHCVSMCGPLVLTYAVKGAEEGPWHAKLTPNIAYQLAKVVSYMLVGLALGAIGSAFSIDAIRPYVMYLAGAFMIVLGLGMTGRVPWAARLTPRPPRILMNALVKLRRRASADADAGESSLATPVLFGLMTGLLPCGPLMAAQVSAAASGSALLGAAGMAAFAVGTAPLMIAFGTAGSLLPATLKRRMMSVLAVGVVLFGLVFIDRGLMLTGAPVNFNTVKTAVLGTGGAAQQGAGSAGDATAPSFTRGQDGVVEVPLAIINTRFVPSTLAIPADEPVRLIVDRQEANACSDQLALPQLGVLVDLAPNAVTTVELPATGAGTYTLTCGMGMMSGSLVVGAGASTGERSGGSAWLTLLALASVAGLVLLVRRSIAPAATTPEGPWLSRIELIFFAVIILLAVFAGLVVGGLF